MSDKINITTDICVLGGGSAGLSVAAGASQMGANVVLVEKGKMGGDCLNYGCVPSKALIAAAKMAAIYKKSSHFGVHYNAPNIDMGAVHGHIHDIIASIAPHDSVERFESLGVKVISNAGKFISPSIVEAGNYHIKAKYFVIATGSSARIIPVKGLENIPYFTNENIFDVKEKIDHLLIIGSGPIGCEIGQAHARLGTKVTILGSKNFLAREDVTLSAIIKNECEKEGMNIIEYATLAALEKNNDTGFKAFYKQGNASHSLTASHLLLATGRQANTESLNLKNANIALNKNNFIDVDSHLRAKGHQRIFAIGDVRGGEMFTHSAAYDAGIVIKNILFKLPAKADYSAIPRVTYTSPEIASVGLNEDSAIEKFSKENITVLTSDFADNDRARTQRTGMGRIKIIANKKGVILGAHIVHDHAGDLLSPWIIAVADKLKMAKMASYVMPYPTLSEISKRVAGSYFTPKLYSHKTRRIVAFLLKYFS